jgi:NAD(P)-dependent dehydrogenase (short-subunit alcohol dehydrogenase family)
MSRMEAGTSLSPTGKGRAAAPLGRPGTPEDVARGVLMLASPLADFITGAAVVIDGGASAGPVALRVVDP